MSRRSWATDVSRQGWFQSASTRRLNYLFGYDDPCGLRYDLRGDRGPTEYFAVYLRRLRWVRRKSDFVRLPVQEWPGPLAVSDDADCDREQCAEVALTDDDYVE